MADLKGRPEEGEQEPRLDEKHRLPAKIGELAMENKLLYERIHNLEGGLPAGQRSSKS